MADTEKVLAAARDLGKLIAETELSKRFEKAVESLKSDTDAQRALADLNRHTTVVMQKQATGQPIEVADKQKLEQLRGAVSTNLTLGNFQMAQMDFLDLMRKVDDAISGQTAMGEKAPDVPGGMSGAPGAADGQAGGAGGPAGPIITE